MRRVATSNTEPRAGLPLLPLAEVALAGVSLATVAGLWRLFDDASYVLPLAGHAIAAHVLAAALRRHGVAPLASAVVCLIAAVFALSWGHLWSTTSYGFPVGETASAAADELSFAWTTFGEIRAPAPVLTGFLLSAGAALWVGAWLADLAAFRVWAPFEALIPSGTLFIFASIFSAERARGFAAVLWLAAALAFALLHRTARQQSSPSWLGSDARLGTHALVKVGAGLSVAAVLTGWVIGPLLPGADAEPLLPFGRGEGGGGTRRTVSPLVEMRGRLVELSQVELFTVISAERAYWRLTSLDTFNGDVWSSQQSFGDADGDLSGSATTGVPTKPVSQTFNILDLSTIWLPAAFEAGSVHVNEADDVDVRWDDVSSTLIVPTDLDTSDGLRYEVVSDIPTFDPAGLVGTGDVPRQIAERNRDLPSDFPPAVTDLARSIVAGASTPYEQALALQNSFRDGSFTYSLAAAPGHSESAIENFLFVTRTGYCEQFAGAFAAMARAVDLPARVAVGFTPGDRDPADPSRYIVRGEHAHAWPEVWIPGAGWVAFEPTPGRGAPGARAYTGVEESQDTAGLSTEPTTVPEDAPGPDDTVPEDGGAGASTTVPLLGDVGAELPPIEPPEDDSVLPSASRLALGIAIALPALLVVLGGAGSIVAGTRALRRHRWRAQAQSPEDRVRADGHAVLDYVGVLGIVRRPFETHAEFGRRLAALVGEPAAVRLGELLTRADFDPAGVSEEDAEEADTILAAIHDAVRVRTTRWQRARAAMDPRSAERRARARGPRPSGPRIQISTAGTGR